MKLTKLQRDALRLARWWNSDGDTSYPIKIMYDVDVLDRTARVILHMHGIWDDEINASALLSEVF